MINITIYVSFKTLNGIEIYNIQMFPMPPIYCSNTKIVPSRDVWGIHLPFQFVAKIQPSLFDPNVQPSRVR